jgi:uncharacterized protein YbjT (DUF2867 family)
MIAILIGATGLIGKSLLNQLLADNNFTLVKVFHRRSTGLSHDKLQEHVIDFDKPDSWAAEVTGDVLFSTLGTTLKTAGSKEAQYRVDFTYNYDTAKAAAANGVKSYVLLSSTGADASSRVFYSRMKGELDDAVKKLDFEQIRIIKPSVLEGDRDEFRLGESIGIVIGKAFSFLPGVRKYRPIKDQVVAKAMIQAAKKEGLPPVSEFELEEVHKLGD